MCFLIYNLNTAYKLSFIFKCVFYSQDLITNELLSNILCQLKSQEWQRST